MRNIFMDLKNLKPSQLYINQAKIKSLEKIFNPLDANSNQPLPIKQFEEEIFFTDGHTRAFLYFKAGIKKIPVYWDKDVLDLDLYKECLEWCKEDKIEYIGNLENRIVSNESYYELWIKRCEDFARKSTKK